MKSKHLRPKMIFTLLSILLPLVLLCLVLFGYTCYKNYDYNVKTIRTTQDSVSNSIDDQLDSIVNQAQRQVYSMNFLYFTNSSQLLRVTSYSDTIAKKLKDNVSFYPMYRGVIFYNNAVDRLYAYNLDTSKTVVEDRSMRYANLLLQFETKDSKRESKFCVCQIDGVSYLTYVVNQRYGSMAILISPERNDVLKAFNEFSEKPITISYTEPSSQAIATQVQDLPLYLTYESGSFFSYMRLDAFQIIVLSLIILLLCAIIYMFFYFNRLMISPLLYLSDSFEMIGQNDKTYRIDRTSDIYEINQFYTGFNNMLDGIRDAEDQSHRMQMDAVQAKLQYLQLQIRPHFYLNCLKNINSLAEMQDYKKIQELVIYLSDYFRYNFQDVKNFVTVREEIEASQRYIDLCRCLYNEIDLEFDLESDVLSAQCLPISILTFVENAIKHSVDLKELLIRISSHIELKEDGDAYVYVKIENTGHIKDEILEELNQASGSQMVYARERVGISNVRYRMWLIYEDRFNIHFSNNDGNAVAEIRFPVNIVSAEEL